MLITGGEDAFNALVFQQPNPININWVRDQFNTLGQNIPALNEYGKSFIEASKQMFADSMNSQVMNTARHAINQVKGLFRPNVIMTLDLLEDLQTAQDCMKRWLMASPVLKPLYNDGRVYGYGEGYEPLHGDSVGEDNYDYRLVMNGVCNTDEETGTLSYKIYGEELYQEEDYLTPHDRLDIVNSWDAIAVFVASGKDPTDPWGGEIS